MWNRFETPLLEKKIMNVGYNYTLFRANKSYKSDLTINDLTRIIPNAESNV